jgi:hypothetical protein
MAAKRQGREAGLLLADYFQSEGLWMVVPFGSGMTAGNWWCGMFASGSRRQVTPKPSLLLYARDGGIYQLTSRINCDGVIRKGCPDFFALAGKPEDRGREGEKLKWGYKTTDH